MRGVVVEGIALILACRKTILVGKMCPKFQTWVLELDVGRLMGRIEILCTLSENCNLRRQV